MRDIIGNKIDFKEIKKIGLGFQNSTPAELDSLFDEYISDNEIDGFYSDDCCSDVQFFIYGILNNGEHIILGAIRDEDDDIIENITSILSEILAEYSELSNSNNFSDKNALLEQLKDLTESYNCIENELIEIKKKSSSEIKELEEKLSDSEQKRKELLAKNSDLIQEKENQKVSSIESKPKETSKVVESKSIQVENLFDISKKLKSSRISKYKLK